MATLTWGSPVRIESALVSALSREFVPDAALKSAETEGLVERNDSNLLIKELWFPMRPHVIGFQCVSHARLHAPI